MATRHFLSRNEDITLDYNYLRTNGPFKTNSGIFFKGDFCASLSGTWQGGPTPGGFEIARIPLPNGASITLNLLLVYINSGGTAFLSQNTSVRVSRTSGGAYSATTISADINQAGAPPISLPGFGVGDFGPAQGIGLVLTNAGVARISYNVEIVSTNSIANLTVTRVPV